MEKACASIPRNLYRGNIEAITCKQFVLWNRVFLCIFPYQSLIAACSDLSDNRCYLPVSFW